MTPNKYKDYSPDQLEELFSNFLIDSWSYSKVATFARNEKEFERRFIYREISRLSATTVAGQAYHFALQQFFLALQDGEHLSIAEMEKAAYSYIDSIKTNDWKLQKTTPTVEDCILKANASVTKLIGNFYSEQDIYLSDLAEVLDVEVKAEEWLVINGVDIPLPCHMQIDLVIRTNDDKLVVIDHKSKTAFTPEDEAVFTIGKQAITYVRGYEAHTGKLPDEVWFIENKESKNKDGSPQLKKIRVEMTPDNLKLYETLLYEPLKRMVEAVSDPDYVYVINDNDNIAERAEMYNFWAKTMIAEVDDFRVPEDKKPLIERRLKKIRDASLASINPKLISSFRKKAATFITYDLNETNMTDKEKIQHVLRTFGIVVNVAHEIEGYSSKTYLLEMAAGVKIGNVHRYALDIANAINVPSIRIAPNLVKYQGRTYLCIESPQRSGKILLWNREDLHENKIPIGRDNFDNLVVWDLDNHSTPHMLICGATGSGKSVCIISTIEYALAAGINDIYVFDPKYEFIRYRTPNVKVFNEIEDIEEQMRNLVKDMQARAKSGIIHKTLIIFDEFADAVSAAKSGPELDIREEVITGMRKDGTPKMEIRVTGRLKSLEENLKILLQKGRSLGFRIIAATQRASTQIITGDAKVNFPVQICFRVPKEIDSKVVLDEAGAESLNGKGDGLIKSPEYENIIRFQGYYKP